jgi:O-antigen/teichoic acid export membrane protein
MQFTKLNRAGLIIALLLGLLDLSAPFTPTPDGEDGPPYAILLIDAVLGLITVVAVVIAWRTARRGAVRIAAGARIISAVTALPAFFVEVPAALQAAVGLFVVVTIACVVLMLAPSRRPVTVSD